MKTDARRRARFTAVVVLVLFAIPLNLLLLTYTEGIYSTDFGAFIMAGRAARRGLDPYQIYPRLLGDRWKPDAPNLNGPVSVPILELAGDVDPTSALRAWQLLSALLYVGLVLLLSRMLIGRASSLSALWAVAMAGPWDMIVTGQVYVVLLAIVAGAWLLLRRDQQVLAGCLIGLLVAIKPNFLVWPALLVAGRHWRPALASLASTLTFCLWPLLVYGPVIYRQWLGASSLMTNSSISDPPLLRPVNGSLLGIAARLGVPSLGYLLAGLMLLGLAAWAWRNHPSIGQISGVALAATLLAGPLAWVGYAVVLVPSLFERRWTPTLIAGAALLAVPLIVVTNLHGVVARLGLSPLGSVYGAALILALVGMLAAKDELAPKPGQSS